MISVCFRQDWDPLIVIVDSSEKFLCSTRADAFKEDKAGGRPEAEAFMIKLATDFCHNAVGLLGEPIDVNNLREEKKKRILAAGLPTKLPSNRNTKKTSAKERKRAGGAPPQIEAASGSTVASSAVAAAASSGAAVAASCGAHVPKQKVKAAAKPKRVAKRALSDGSPFGPALDEPPHQRRWKNLIEFLEAPGVGDGNQAPKGAAAAPAIPTVGDATPPTPEIAAPTPPLSLAPLLATTTAILLPTAILPLPRAKMAKDRRPTTIDRHLRSVIGKYLNKKEILGSAPTSASSRR